MFGVSVLLLLSAQGKEGKKGSNLNLYANEADGRVIRGLTVDVRFVLGAIYRDPGGVLSGGTIRRLFCM